MDSVGKFTNPVKVFVDCFEGTFDVSKAFPLLPKHLLFITLNIYVACIDVSKEIIVKLYALQLLNPRSNFTRNKATLSDLSVFVSSMDEMFLK